MLHTTAYNESQGCALKNMPLIAGPEVAHATR